MASVGYLWKRDAKSLDYKFEMGFDRAIGSSRYVTPHRTFYGPPDVLRRRNCEFGKTFFKRDRSILRTHVRDLFEFNL